MESEFKQDLKEKLIVGLTFIGVFLPIRLFFYTYVSQYWLGSFGMISAIALVFFVLLHYNRLGKFGQIWKRQLLKITKGKIGIILFAQAFFVLAVQGAYIYFIEQGNTVYQSEIESFDTFLVQQNITAYELVTSANLEELETGANRFVDGLANPDFINMITDPDTAHFVFSMAFYVANQLTGGWVLHFNIVLLVESAEQICILTYFRFFYKTKDIHRELI